MEVRTANFMTTITLQSMPVNDQYSFAYWFEAGPRQKRGLLNKLCEIMTKPWSHLKDSSVLTEVLLLSAAKRRGALRYSIRHLRPPGFTARATALRRPPRRWKSSPCGGRGGDWSRSAAFAAAALPIGGEEGEHHDFGSGVETVRDYLE